MVENICTIKKIHLAYTRRKCNINIHRKLIILCANIYICRLLTLRDQSKEIFLETVWSPLLLNVTTDNGCQTYENETMGEF